MIQKKRVLRRVVLCFYYNLRTIISNLQTSGRYYCIAGGMFCLLLLLLLSLSLSCMFFFLPLTVHLSSFALYKYQLWTNQLS